MAASSPRPTSPNEDESQATNTLASNVRNGISSLWPRGGDTARASARSDETTPLLARDNVDDDDDVEDQHYDSVDNETTPLTPTGSSTTKPTKRRSLPTIFALLALCLAVIVIMGLGFAAPEAMQEYAEQAAVFEPTKLSIDSFTADGVNANVQGTFYFDGARVQRKSVRDIGRAMTWFARAAETKTTQLTVSLPEYDIELGQAQIPPITVAIKDREKTPIDIVVKVTPGDPAGLKQIASDWIEGRLGQLRLKGEADVPLKSGIFPLGTQRIVQMLTFKEEDVPAIPKYSISKIKVHELDDNSGLIADVSVSAFNEHPVSFDIPPIAFEIFVPGCSPDGALIPLANASTKTIHVGPRAQVVANASGTVNQLSETLLEACPDSSTSPLDDLLKGYMHGDETSLYVRGSQYPLDDTPAWISDILREMSVRIPFTGDSMEDLIHNFTMEETHFSLPNPLADPDTPAGQPRISTDIIVLANLPEEINFPINVSRVRSTADVFYHGDKFGVLELREWQEADSYIVDDNGDRPRLMAIHAAINDAPLGITDQDIFTEVIQGVLFGEEVVLSVKAAVDIEVATALGSFIIREIPAEGKVPLKPLVGDGLLKGFHPTIGDLEIKTTSRNEMKLDARLNVTNPTDFSANVPYVNINLLYNDTLVANISLQDLRLGPGRNVDLPFSIFWDPIGLSHETGAVMGRDLLSRHISGFNTSISVRTHAGSFPSTPWLGAALSSFEIKLPTPSLSKPRTPHDPNDPDAPDDGDDDDRKDGPHFIDEATMHLISSTADFTLLSPFQRTTLYIIYIDATAMYNGTDPVGNITYELPIKVAPGATKTPRLPVDWSIDGVGYGAVKDALGGTLKLGALATVTVRIGEWIQTVDFVGKGIGAHIQL